jgi:hypothetical protein
MSGSRTRWKAFSVKNRDGRIAEKDSYGNDPRNVPG